MRVPLSVDPVKMELPSTSDEPPREKMSFQYTWPLRISKRKVEEEELVLNVSQPFTTSYNGVAFTWTARLSDECAVWTTTEYELPNHVFASLYYKDGIAQDVMVDEVRMSLYSAMGELIFEDMRVPEAEYTKGSGWPIQLSPERQAHFTRFIHNSINEQISLQIEIRMKTSIFDPMRYLPSLATAHMNQKIKEACKKYVDDFQAGRVTVPEIEFLNLTRTEDKYMLHRKVFMHGLRSVEEICRDENESPEVAKHICSQFAHTYFIEVLLREVQGYDDFVTLLEGVIAVHLPELKKETERYICREVMKLQERPANAQFPAPDALQEEEAVERPESLDIERLQFIQLMLLLAKKYNLDVLKMVAMGVLADQIIAQKSPPEEFVHMEHELRSLASEISHSSSVDDDVDVEELLVGSVQDDVMHFEKSLIKSLQEERVGIQKKTFTKYINSFLNRAGLEVGDIFKEFNDGVLLMKLLEIISGEKLGKPNKGRMRVQKIENLNKVLEFLKKKKIQLENIGAEDILDGNERLILGLIWTIILRFQIDTIVIDAQLENFTSSWRSGLAFNALIHAHRPDLLQYDGLNAQDHMGNLNNAFDIAEKKLDIARLLDAEDVDVGRPDEKSIITYVSLYYHHFAKQKTEMTGAKRVANIVGKLMTQEQMEDEYQGIASDLLEWIKQTIGMLNNRRFPNSLKGIKEEMVRFNQFRNIEKPCKYKEKGDLEALFFNIQTKRKAIGMSPFVPQHGLFMKDLETAWDRLDSAENERQTAIINEMLRLQKLEQLAERFYRKAELRDHWLRDMGGHLDELELGRTASDVEAALKKHQAISADILPREERFRILTRICAELSAGNYHEANRVRARDREIAQKWAHLLSVLEAKRKQIMGLNDLMGLLRDIDTLSSELKHLEPVARNRDVGKHILGVDDLIGRHELVEGQVKAHGAWLDNVSRQAQLYIRGKGEQNETLQRKLEDVNAQYENLRALCQQRRNALHKARELFQFIQDHEEEMTWLAEKESLCLNALQKGDIANVANISRFHKTIESEMKAHWTRTKEIMAAGEQLAMNGQSRDDVQRRIQQIQHRWESLRKVVDDLANWLQEAERAQQYFQDANEAESWIREKLPLVKSEDYGKDEGQAESLLQRHNRLEEQIHAFRSDIVRLEESASQIASTSLMTGTHATEVDTEETVVPQVEMLYKYSGNGMEVKKAEIVALIDKSNPDWCWAQDTMNVLSDEPSVEHIEAFRKKLDKLEHDIAANGGTQLRRINGMADELTAEGHSETRQIVARQQAVNKLWAHIDQLFLNKTARVQTLEQLDDFNANCADAESWMKAKFDLIDRKPQDLKSLQNLERDLKPLEDKIQSLEELAERVKKSNPEMAAVIQKKINELRGMYADLLSQARQKIQLAEETQGQEMFDGALAEMHAWIEKTKKTLSDMERPVDVQTAEDTLKTHLELGDQIKDKKYAVEYIQELGRRLLVKNPKLNVVKEKLEQLQYAMAEIANIWKSKHAHLKHQLDLQLYNREAERIDAATKGHEACLDFKDLGDSVDSVENLLKRHRDLEAKLDAQEARLDAFSKNADELIRLKHADSTYIHDRRNEVLARREAVRRAASKRRAQLEASLEYQNLRRDGDEVLQWIGDKKKVALDDTHLDLHTIDIKLLKHEAFEAEIKPNTQRVENINKDGAMLVSRHHYESPNIQKLVERVNTSWTELKDAAARRGEKLKQAADQKNLNRILDDANAKLDEIDETLRNKDVGNDLRGVKELLQKHTTVEQEMHLYENKLTEISRRGNVMAGEGHFDAARIISTVKSLLHRFEQLTGPCSARRTALEESLKWHQLAFDVDCELQWIAEKEPLAASEDTGRTLTEALNVLKKHEQLEAEVNQHSRHIEGTIHRGDDLIKGHHAARADIKAKCDQLAGAWAHLQQLVRRRKRIVDWGVKEQQYMFDAAEVESWMAEKRILIESQDYGQDEDAAQKLLARHKALQNDMNTYKQWVERLAVKCAELVDSHRHHVDRFSNKQRNLEAEFDRLSELADKRRALLEDTLCLHEYLRESAELEQWINEQLQTAMSEEYGDDYDHLMDLQTRFENFRTSVKSGDERFKQLVDRVLQWIRERESMVHAGDMGNDLEHCNLLIDQLDGTSADNSVDENTLQEINELGDKLVRQGRSSQKEVHEQKTIINQSWQALQSDIRGYRQQLKMALEVHCFNRDIEDTNERIHEKIVAVQSDDFGRDFASVDQLMRKQHALERDMEETILNSLQRLEQSWKELSDSAEQRHAKLERSHRLYKYLDSVKKADQWASNLRTKMTSHKPPKTTTEARLLIEQHQERKAEIDGRQVEIRVLHEEGQRLIAEQPEHKGEVQRAHKRVQNSEHQLRQTWEQEKASLARALDWLLYSEQCGLVEAWLASKEAVLKDHDLGDNLEAVQMLIKKHDAFEEAVKTQSDKIETVRKDADALLSHSNDYSVQVEERRDEVVARYNALLQRSAHRRTMLLDSQKLLDFVRSCGELITWINAKLQLAYDESYLDPANLRSKLQKHLAFDSELAENEQRLNFVVNEGNKLIKENHFSKQEVEAQLSELKGGWEELRNKSALKTQRLREAYDAFTLARKVDDVERWLDHIEGGLASEDHGKDVLSVEHLVKKLDATQAEVAGRSDHVAEVMTKARELKSKGATDTDQLLKSAEQVELRYAQLGEPIKIRRENLLDAKKLFEWEAEAQEETEWMHDRMPLVRSADFGDSLHSAEHLSKKHALLEAELDTRHASLNEVERKGLEMVRARHFASTQIERRVDELMGTMLQLKELSIARRRKLDAAVISQKYFADLGDAEQWIRDRMPLTNSQDNSKDQAAAESQLRRLGLLEKEAIKFREEIDRLKATADRLVHDDHHDTTQIAARQNRLEGSYAELIRAIGVRKTHLADSSRYHAYVRQADDLMDWLHEKERAAAADEYGRDLEECQRLIEEFDTVVRELAAAGERVASVNRTQEELLRTGHPFGASIRAKGDDLSRLWQGVNESANERQQALTGAKQVHRFDQEADETINWLQEKEADGVALENVDLTAADLNTLTSERQRLEEFIHGLTAVEKQVTELCREADRLESLYPATKDHLLGRKMDMNMLLNDITESANKHRERLSHTEQLQAYFQEHRELISWIKRLFTTITAETLPKDVHACDALANRHNEYRSEMIGRKGHIDSFCNRGRSLVQQGHVLSQEIQRKVEQLERAYHGVESVWNERNELYVENMDVQQWKANANTLEQWMTERENLLGDDWKYVDSVATADERLRDFDDFLVTVDAQGERCEGVKRQTLLEKNFSRQLQREAERRLDQEETTRRRDTIKVVEKGNLLANRRQDRERRKTQEISLMKPSASGEDFASQTLPRKLDGRLERSKTTAIGEPVVSVSGPSTLPIVGSASHHGDASTSSLLAPHHEFPQSQIHTVTPGFSTRRGTSIRRSSGHRMANEQSSIDMTGYVDRKQELQSSGKKATLRSWKNYYTILCGQLLCFFKDEEAFMSNNAASPPVCIYNAICQQYPEYAKRKNAFKLIAQDGAEYLFACSEERQMLEWVAKIKFHASLEPSAQLTAFSQSAAMELSAHGHVPVPPPRNIPYQPTSRSGILKRQHEMGTSQWTDSGPDKRRASQLSSDFADFQVNEGSQFISRVEEQNNPHAAAPTMSNQNGGHSETDDDASVKGSRRRGFSSLFSRSSKKSSK
ncbi:unnamed protein product, partial [Mesorhabditis spiculigera]